MVPGDLHANLGPKNERDTWTVCPAGHGRKGFLKEGHWGVEEGRGHVKVPSLCAGQRKEAYVAGVEAVNGIKECVRIMEDCMVAQGLDLGLRA